MDKARKKDFIVKFCCLILAFSLWLYISNVQNPIKTTVIKNVQVNIINKDILDQYNLVEIPNKNYTVNVTVKGSASEIYSLKSSQFKLEADISAYALKKGTMRIPVEVKAYPSNVSIINPETLWVKLELDNFSKKNVPVKIEVKGNTKSGVKTYEPLVTPKEVVISGPEQYINRVSYGSVEVSLNNEAKKVGDMYSVVPVDVSGNKVDYVSVEPKHVKVQIPLDKTKYVPVEAKIKSLKDKRITSISVIPESVSISGEESELKKIDKLVTEDIDVSKMNTGDTVEVPLKIPKNIKTLDYGKVKVKITFDDTVQKKLSLNIKTKNLKNNLDVVLENKEAFLVVSSQESKLSNLKKEDIECYVDLDSLAEGTYNLPVIINLPDGINKISYNPQTIKVNIKKQEVSETNANKN